MLASFGISFRVVVSHLSRLYGTCLLQQKYMHKKTDSSWRRAHFVLIVEIVKTPTVCHCFNFKLNENFGRCAVDETYALFVYADVG
jgi:hypothetical protein